MSTKEAQVFVSLEEIQALPLHLDAAGLKLLHSLFNEGLTRAYNKAVEAAILSMPHYAVLLLRRSVEMERLREQFLSAHSDLAQAPEFFECLAEIENEHPGWAYDRMLDAAAVRARVRLRGKQAVESLGVEIHPEDKPTLAQVDDLLNGAL